MGVTFTSVPLTLPDRVLLFEGFEGRPFAVHASLLARFTTFFREKTWVNNDQGPILLGTMHATTPALEIFTRWIYARSTMGFVDPTEWYRDRQCDRFEDLVTAWLLGEYLGSVSFRNHIIRLLCVNDTANIRALVQSPVQTKLSTHHTLFTTVIGIWAQLSHPDRHTEGIQELVQARDPLRQTPTLREETQTYVRDRISFYASRWDVWHQAAAMSGVILRVSYIFEEPEVEGEEP
ncbi:hypothetical protein F4821DRAFT_280200 [Hypoxylon rubiginosum]|uniref:Uncharacterized protein n=1 Tax=Hypoxylon rubiginosum TaxID=110542 RepID=A0ACC0DG71_9PEZI|nr:hypothetical protein F4821DRAFT_280200 [Hypoxylon rubiginosum]